MGNKTTPSIESPEEFIRTIEPEGKRNDAEELLNMIGDISGDKATMWGPGIIGFGQYHYKYESGREGDFFRAGFSPRKTALTVYIMSGFDGYESLLAKLGKHKTGKSCLYINKLADVDTNILKQIISRSYEEMNRKYPV